MFFFIFFYKKILPFSIFYLFIYMRNKLEEEKKKEKVSISLSRELMKVVDVKEKNRSKYIEWLIYQDLIKNNLIDSSIMF